VSLDELLDVLVSLFYPERGGLGPRPWNPSDGTCQTSSYRGLSFLYTRDGSFSFSSSDIYRRKKISCLEQVGVRGLGCFITASFCTRRWGCRLFCDIRISIPARRATPRFHIWAPHLQRVLEFTTCHLRYISVCRPLERPSCSSVYICTKYVTACVACGARGLPSMSCTYKQLVSVQLIILRDGQSNIPPRSRAIFYHVVYVWLSPLILEVVVAVALLPRSWPRGNGLHR